MGYIFYCKHIEIENGVTLLCGDIAQVFFICS